MVSAREAHRRRYPLRRGVDPGTWRSSGPLLPGCPATGWVRGWFLPQPQPLREAPLIAGIH
jgi:hypothetical protein